LASNLYYEITFRVPQSSFNRSNYSNDSAGFDFWQDNCNSCNAQFYQQGGNGCCEIDFYETHVVNYANGNPTHLYLAGWGPCATAFPIGNPPTNCANIDVTNYHTYGTLTTNDGRNFPNNSAAQCFYIDPQNQGASPTPTANPCQVLGCSGCVNQGGYQQTATGHIMTLWVTPGSCYGNPDPCMIAGQFDMYIKSIRIWGCPHVWDATGCAGTLVTSELEKDRPWYAWLTDALSSIIPEARAGDVFDPDQNGLWYCTDGRLSNKDCMPPEFRGKTWWSACLPGRSDCVSSEKAFLGWDYKGARRGRGFCYTTQPYTCAPDGKWPQ
jgi:hypothetical protein